MKIVKCKFGLFLPAVFFSIILFFGNSVAQSLNKPAAIDTNTARALFFDGLREKLNENYAKAEESFKKLLAFHPQHTAAYYELAVVTLRQNKLLEAEIAIKKATTADPKNLWYWRMLVELYKQKGDMVALADVLDRMIKLSPNEDSFYFDRANALLLAGKTAAAVDSYKMIEQKFGPSEALEKARSRIQRSDVNPVVTKPEQLLIDGETLFKSGDLKGAMKKFEEVNKLTDQLYIAWEHLMRTQVLLGLYQDAIKTGDEALSLYPSQAVLYFHYAVALLNTGKLDEAMTQLKTAMELDDANPVLLECFGDILFLKGNVEAALQQWNRSKAGGNKNEKLSRKIHERKYIK